MAIDVTPEVGEFETVSPPADMVVSYQYGFPAAIGAGPYDRSLLGNPPAPVGTVTTVSGGHGLDTALTAAAGHGTVEIEDSQTYTAVSNPGSTASPIQSLLVQAGDLQRPVVRLAPPAAATDPPSTWTFTGGGGEALSEQGLPSLTLDGLLVSGGDIVLQGAFASVRLTGFTADPGTSGGGGGFATAVDGRSLTPTTIWIEADPNAGAGNPNAIEHLEIDSCVLGPVRTRNGGAVLNLTITDSTVQGIAPPATPDTSTLTTASVYDPALLVTVLASQWTPAFQLYELLPAAAQHAVKGYTGGAVDATSLQAILDGLNGLITGTTSLNVSAPALAYVPVEPDAPATTGGADLAALNRALLESALPVALAPAALACDAGSVALERVSVMGPAFVHSLTASDCILAEFTVVEDAQDGCVRYSAVASGSYTPRQFSCAQIVAGASLFTSTDFGQPGYGQLRETVDQAIVAAAAGVTVSTGAENGSEMGAYCSGLAPIKENGLLIKYDEYMPLGLTPVIVHVT